MHSVFCTNAALKPSLACTSKTIIETTSIKDLVALDLHNKEGFVIRFDDGPCIKVKCVSYVALHGVVSSVNPKAVLKWYGEGKTLENVCAGAGVPDELMP